MIDQLSGMWNRSKILFFLLLPLVILAIGFKLYREYQVLKAKESLKETIDKNKKLEGEKQQILSKAELEKQKADEAAKRREDRKEDDIDEDWHKRS